MSSKMDIVLYKLNNFRLLEQYDYDAIMEYVRLSGSEGEKARTAIKLAARRGFQAFQHIPKRNISLERVYAY